MRRGTNVVFVFRGKGTPRRKTKKVHKSSGTDDKKLQTSLKKLNVQPIQAIEEVNMFKEDGNVIHFAAPKGMLLFLGHSIRKGDMEPDTLLQFTQPFLPTHSPSTATVRTRNSPNSYPASSANSVPTLLLPCAVSPSLTRAYRRRKEERRRRAKMKTMRSRSWSKARTLKARSSKREAALR